MTQRPRIRVEPEDFVVEEVALQAPDGEGAHLWLWIEKRLCNTHQVITDLARRLGLEGREIGYAGRKDRRAVTRQWISVPAHVESELATVELEGVRILDVVPSRYRLRLGELRGNRFQLRIHGVDGSLDSPAMERLVEIRRRGLPNRFGPQRFGRDGRNVERGVEILRRGRVRGNRRQGMLMLSALQSAVFNHLLASRSGSYDGLLEGDIAVDHRNDELIMVSDPAELQGRCEGFEISPTGPMFGSKMRWPRGEVMELEEQAMDAFDLPPIRRLDLPRSLKLYGGRRSLRAAVSELEWQRQGDDVELRFVLPAGSYATVLLDELFPQGYDEGASDGS